MPKKTQIVLSVVIFMGIVVILAASLGSSLKNEARIQSNERNTSIAYYLAQAAAERGIIEVINDVNYAGVVDQTDLDLAGDHFLYVYEIAVVNVGAVATQRDITGIGRVLAGTNLVSAQEIARREITIRVDGVVAAPPQAACAAYTRTFRYWEIYDLARDDGAGIPDPNQGHSTRCDDVTAQRVCTLGGYNNMDGYSQTQWSSPGDNWVWWWNTASSSWHMANGNSSPYWMDNLICSDPTCDDECHDGIDNDGDGGIDWLQTGTLPPPPSTLPGLYVDALWGVCGVHGNEGPAAPGMPGMVAAVAGDFSPGDTMSAINITGIYSDPGERDNEVCATATGVIGGMSAPLLRFFNAAGNGIGSVYEFVGFQNVVVPAGAASLNAYFTDSRMDDNTGGCTFDLEIDPFTDVDCADGSDNDGDGRIDFCLADGSNAATCDDGCAVPEDMSEIPHDETCTGPDGLEGCDEQADQIDIPPTRCLGTGSGGPSCPSCGSCSKGSCGGSMYGAVAADGSTPVVDEMRQDIPNFDAIFGKGTGYDDATSLRTCNLLGYANFCCKYWHGYSHPFDENVIMYDAVNGVWISRSNAGNAVGGCNKRLKCSHPLPRCSNNLDDDGDCLVDFPDDAGCADATDDDERGGSSGGGDGQDVDGEIAPVTWQMQ